MKFSHYFPIISYGQLHEYKILQEIAGVVITASPVLSSCLFLILDILPVSFTTALPLLRHQRHLRSRVFWH
jgi:hypothetical protein